MIELKPVIPDEADQNPNQPEHGYPTFDILALAIHGFECEGKNFLPLADIILATYQSLTSKLFDQSKNFYSTVFSEEFLVRVIEDGRISANS